MSSNDENRRKDRVFVLGLTGGIGTGKSTAARHLKEKGLYHIDADEISRKLTADNRPLLRLLDVQFGPANDVDGDGISRAAKGTVLLQDGKLDRKALADIVFSDPLQKERLDGIMFNQITAEIEAIIEASTGPVLLDAPLLFESGLDRLCHRVILLTADMEERIKRACARDGSSREDVLARVKAQMNDDDKISRADYVVDNSGTRKELYKKLEEVYDMISRDLC